MIFPLGIWTCDEHGFRRVLPADDAGVARRRLVVAAHVRVEPAHGRDEARDVAELDLLARLELVVEGQEQPVDEVRQRLLARLRAEFRIQPNFNARLFDGLDAGFSAVLRGLHESDRFVQKSAEPTSI